MRPCGAGWGGSLRILVACAALPAVFAACSPGGVVAPPVDPPQVEPLRSVSVAEENSRPGTKSWYVENSLRALPTDLSLYAAPYDVVPGDTLRVYVDAAYSSVSLLVYRLGWYGGLGGRLVAQAEGVSVPRQVPCASSLPSPLPSATPSPIECPWSVSHAFATDLSWTSGLYLLKARDARGLHSFYPFVVRPVPGQSAAILAVIPQFTWQAYNNFGGRSFYTTAAVQAPAVSFLRPYGQSGGTTTLFGTRNSDMFAVRFLERSGFPVLYASDRQLALDSLPFSPRVLLFTGHDEYWTYGMRVRVQAKRDAGVHLAFLSSNAAYWNTRMPVAYSDTVQPVVSNSLARRRAGDILVSYKSKNDPGASGPSDVTSRFRDAPLFWPENTLMGVGLAGLAAPSSVRYVVGSPKGEGASFLAAAGMVSGSSIGLETTEGDGLMDNVLAPPGVQVLLSSPFLPSSPTASTGFFHTTFFVAISGAGVFASGSDAWVNTLDNFYQRGVPQLMDLTKSVLDWMLSH